MKSKSLLFLTLCLFFNACSNEDELMTPDSKRVKREVTESIPTSKFNDYLFSLDDIIYESSILFDKREDAKECEKLMKFKIGHAITDKLKRLNLPASSGWDIQLMKHAYGRIVNMDYFPVTIEKMPTVNGKELSPLEFFEHVRKNINDFISFMGTKFYTMDEVSRDDPRFKGETRLWQLNNPFLALLSITIPLNDGSCDLLGL